MELLSNTGDSVGEVEGACVGGEDSTGLNVGDADGVILGKCDGCAVGESVVRRVLQESVAGAPHRPII
jgi:hypothetical protein